MNNPRGQVISINPDNSVVVDIESALACERCASGKGCGAGLLGARQGERRITALVADHLQLESGDAVSVALEPSNVLRAATIVYGYPLLAAIAMAGLAYKLRMDDVGAALSALGGLLAGIIVARWRLQGARCLRQFTPVVIERLPLDAN